MSAATQTLDTVQSVTQSGYKWGWETEIEMDLAPKGLNEDIIRLISSRKEEPAWLLEWRLKAFAGWQQMTEPHWARVEHAPIDYQDLHYYAAPKKKPGPKSLDEVDPELLRTYEKLGIPLKERAILAGVDPASIEGGSQVAVDAVFDSVSVATTFRETLKKAGVIFCPISEAVRDYPELVQQYLGTVVPISDNFFAALNSAVFTDGSFVYVPKGVRCPMELSTYFRINARSTGQFERTLIIADAGAYVSYLEGCTAPMRDENQLHAAVVELVTHDDAQIKYSHGAELVPRRRGRSRRHLQLRHQARRLPRRAIQDLVDAGGDRFGDHLEVSVLRAARRRQRRRVLLGGGDQQPPAGRYRHQDGAYRQADEEHDRLQGDQRRALQQHLSWPGARAAAGRRRAQPHAV